MIGKSKLLPYKFFKEAVNTPVEHLFGCHKLCEPSWCYTAKIDDARNKFNTAVARSVLTTTVTTGDNNNTAAITTSSANTVTTGEEVSLQSPDKVISPTERCVGVDVQIPASTDVSIAGKNNNTAVATAVPTTPVTAGEEVLLQSSDEVIIPTEHCRGVEVKIPASTDISVDPSASLVNFMSDDSSKFSSSSEASDSDDNIDTYKGRYTEEDDNINFFCDLVSDSIDGLETMVFSTTDLVTLKEKEKLLRAKEEGKYFCSKLDHLILYGKITTAVVPYLTKEKMRMLMHNWSTQINEAMNNSVAAYAPKIKNFSGTISLKT